jgi:hypothetical protein
MFNPPITPVDLHAGYADVSALLTILADPAAHKQRLDQLIEQENSVKAQIAALNEMADDTRRQNSAAQAATIVADRRKLALDQREAALDERAATLDQAENLRSDTALRRREAAVTAREEAAGKETQRLAALRATTEAKAERIKNLAGEIA